MGYWILITSHPMSAAASAAIFSMHSFTALATFRLILTRCFAPRNVVEGATHFEPNTVPPNRWTDYTKAFFDCHLSDSEEGCDVIFGSGENSLCSGEVAMTECIFDVAPSSQDN